jgi:hypothetical protein
VDGLGRSAQQPREADRPDRGGSGQSLGAVVVPSSATILPGGVSGTAAKNKQTETLEREE